jgi:hypothetical protein
MFYIRSLAIARFDRCLLCKATLRQQSGLKMVLTYVTNVLVKVNIIRTRCMLFYFAKTIRYVS